MRTTGSIWKWLVIAAGIILLLVSVIYSNYLARALAESERDKVELYLKTLEDILDVSDLNRDVRYQQEVLQILDNIQVIFVYLQALASVTILLPVKRQDTMVLILPV